MPKLSMAGPFHEGDLHDNLGAHPMRAQFRQSDGFRERRSLDLETVQLRAKAQEERGVEAGSHLARENKIVSVEVADEQRSQSHSPALRIGEAADHELLGGLAFHLQPVARAPVLVGCIAPLRDHTLPTLLAGQLPWLG